MKLEGDKQGRKGHLSVATEVSCVPYTGNGNFVSIAMVEFKWDPGNTWMQSATPCNLRITSLISVFWIAGIWGCTFSLHGWVAEERWRHFGVSQCKLEISLYQQLETALSLSFSLCCHARLQVTHHQNLFVIRALVSLCFFSTSHSRVVLLPQFYKNLSKGLKDIVWKVEGEDNAIAAKWMLLESSVAGF